MAVFAVLCSELSAIEVSSSAEILGRRRLDERKNSQIACCSSLFSLRNSNNHKGSPTASNSFTAVRDEMKYAYSQRYHNRYSLSI
jgi:hypothetical protein